MKPLTDQLGVPFVLPRRTRSGWATLGVALLVGALVSALVFHFVGNAALNRFLRPKLEQAFAEQNPGYSLRVGAVHYAMWGDRLRCTDVVVTQGDGVPVRAATITVTGVRWSRLLLGDRKPANLFARARLEVADLSAGILAGEYRVRFALLRVSVPAAEIVVQRLGLQPAASDDAFFATTAFRRVRYRLEVAGCTVRGVSFDDLFVGRAYHATALELTGVELESLVNREKPPQPVTKPQPMPHEALAAIAKPFRLDRLTLTDGSIKYAARRAPGAEPGVLTFSALQIDARDIANEAAGGKAITLRATTKLMDAGTFAVEMRLPVATPALAFHYSGTLSAMDLTRLDEYMAGTGRIQIASGQASELAFDIEVAAGHARGTLQGAYRDLQVKVVDAETGRAESVKSRVATVVANQLKVKDDNLPDKTGEMKTGKVDYVHKPGETFLQFAWLALRTGILDLIDPTSSGAH